MSDSLVFLFGGVLVLFGASVLYTAEKFKRRSLRRKRIRREYLRISAWQMLKIALLAWLGFIFVYGLGYVAGEGLGLDEAGLLVLCLAGLLLVAALILSGYVVVLWGVLRLPFESNFDNGETGSKHYSG